MTVVIGTVRRIQQLAADDAGITVERLLGRDRCARVARARQAAIRVAYDVCAELTTPMLGRMFGGRDHTTVLHALSALRRQARSERREAALRAVAARIAARYVAERPRV